MHAILKSAVIGTTFIVLMGLAPLHPGFIPEAAAFVRAPVARTAVIVGTTAAVVASSTANANAAAAANANAAAVGNANAAAANAAAHAGPPPVGTMVTSLPRVA